MMNDSVDEITNPSLKIQRQQRAENLPLSFAQQRLWFLQHLAPDNTAYHLPLAFHISGKVNPLLLEKSLNSIVARHEALRTRFPVNNGQPVQFILPRLSLPLPVIDMQHIPSDRQVDIYTDLLFHFVHQPFDLSHGPLLRYLLVQLQPQTYIFILAMHHIISDGWSLGVLHTELAILYSAFLAGVPPVLPQLPVQYADFTLWQHEALQDPARERLLNYWKQTLADMPPFLPLPTKGPRPPKQTFNGAIYRFSLPAALLHALKQFSKQEKVTLFMTLVSAFQLLLSRYTGQTDIVIGTPIAYRNQLEFEGLIGFFANTLVLRNSLPGNSSFRKLLARTRSSALAAYAHQDLPFEQLVEELHPARDLSYNPLIQVLFVHQTIQIAPARLANLDVTPLVLDFKTAQFDLTLEVSETPSGDLQGHIEYNIDLFTHETVSRMASHFHHLLRQIITQPDLPVEKLSLLTQDERHTLLEEWNATEAPLPDDLLFHHLFEQQARKTSDATAVIFGDEYITYAHLNQRANQLAHYLCRQKVGLGTLVGVYLERSVDMLVALLGILKAGGAYVPLDPTHPEERVAYMIQDSHMPVLLAGKELLPQTLPIDRSRVAILEFNAATFQEESIDNPHREIQAEHPIYVIYTSGSTGRPKGVCIPHRALLNFLYAMRHNLPIHAEGTMLAITTISFDISTLELFLPLMIGARVVLADRATTRDGAALCSCLARNPITMMQATPTTWRMLLSAGWPGTAGLHMLCGGEALSPELAAQLIARGESLWNMYGPTETTVWSSMHKIEPEAGDPISIGRPLANTRMYILDSALQPVPAGVPGELYIGGTGLAREYLHQPALTAERFVPHPFCQAPGARLYKTGDLCRYSSDGAIECIGRADRQVKLRGFRIELDEVAASLQQHPSVKDCVVLLLTDHLHQQRLVSYIVATHGGLSARVLRAFLKKTLPDYMLPEVYIMVPALPQTANGKLDIHALPCPDWSGSVPAPSISVPQTPTEKIVRDIWMDVLKRNDIGLHDNFFEIGGNSLSGSTVMYQIRTLFTIDLPLHRLFEAPTLAQLAREVDAYTSGKQVRHSIPFQTNGQSDPPPLSFNQEHRLLLNQRLKEQGLPPLVRNIFSAFQIEGHLDHALLQRSIQYLIERHDILRTFFPCINEQTTQCIRDSLTLDIQMVDIQSLPEAARDKEAATLAEREINQPFFPERGPLIHFLLIRLAKNTCIFLIVMEHILADGWSMGVLVRELSTIYNALLRNAQPLLTGLPIQFIDYACWQRQSVNGEALEELRAYWRHVFEASSFFQLDLPFTRVSPENPRFTSNTGTLELSESLTQSLQLFCQREKITPFMALVAALSVVLHTYTKMPDIGIFSPVAHRDLPETANLIGWLAGRIYIRSNCAGDPTLAEIIKRVRGACIDAYTHKDLPVPLLMDIANEAAGIGNEASVFPIMFFDYDDTPPNALDLQGTVTRPFDVNITTATIGLSLFAFRKQGTIAFQLLYGVDTYQDEDIKKMLTNLRTVIEHMLFDPDQCLSSLTF